MHGINKKKAFLLEGKGLIPIQNKNIDDIWFVVQLSATGPNVSNHKKLASPTSADTGGRVFFIKLSSMLLLENFTDICIFP